MARIWAKFILFGMGFTIKSKSQALEPDKSYMIVANHSMTDIMLMRGEKPFVLLEK
jgi:1-acyl-sn-glycerol-3-phosphate acyltransferase